MNGRSCNPTDAYIFSEGDSIDFTFGLSQMQSDILFYNVGNS